MIQFFSADYNGPAFEYFGTAHLGTLLFLVLLNLYLLHFRHSFRPHQGHDPLDAGHSARGE